MIYVQLLFDLHVILLISLIIHLLIVDFTPLNLITYMRKLRLFFDVFRIIEIDDEV